MSQIFVDAIAGPEQRVDLQRSVVHSVDRHLVIENFSDATYPELIDIERRGRGFYAWGLWPDPENVENWFKMGSGDLVLLVYDGAYRHFARVLGRYENRRAAEAIWGNGVDNVGTREYMFFLSEPAPLSTPVGDLEDWLPGNTPGFSRLSDERSQHINDEFGSLERFARKRLLNVEAGGPVLDMSGMLQVSEQEMARLRRFDPESRKEGLNRILETILERRGEPHFRRTLLEAYEGRCAITNSNAPDALEATYIIPYRGKYTNDASNGLLLRADVHTLFDLGKLAIDTRTMTVVLSDDLIHSNYRLLAGRPLRYPGESGQRPDTGALDLHRRLAGL